MHSLDKESWGVLLKTMYSPENLLQAKLPIFSKHGTKPQKFPKLEIDKKSFPAPLPKIRGMTQVNIWKSPKKQKLFHSHLREDTKWGFLAFLRLILFPKNGFGTV